MEKSAFIQWIEKYFKGIVVHIVETVNDKNKDTLTYMFKTMLRKEFSVTGKWESINILNTRVSADFVALDSSLPLKRRDSIGKVSGDIVKSGMELYLNESQLQELDTMVATGATDAEIVAKLFEDTPRVIIGIYELMERCFLEGFSSGVTMLDDKDNVGTGVRIDYGYLDSNKSGVKVVWSNANDAKPLDDLRKMIKQAKVAGFPVSEVYMDEATFDQFVASKQVKDFFAWSLKVANGVVVPTPSLEEINAALKRDSKYKITIHVIDRTILVERDGKRKSISPWSAGKVILTGSTEVGVLTYAKLAEENHPVEGVSYQKADDYILVSRFRQNRPSVAEYTSSQARVVPVICNVESIFQIDTKVVQE
ncbi:MAG: major capsid protein [Bacteroidales bacterium]|nr:major capsid protein [Porphyromonas sp.]MDD6934519.1 major capsid protein [Bacteroidales bacterium]MDY3102731.1 major capsid protein [Porphyromonas sp.]